MVQMVIYSSLEMIGNVLLKDYNSQAIDSSATVDQVAESVAVSRKAGS